VFLKDGRPELSNNLAENYIRPFVIGRKGVFRCDSRVVSVLFSFSQQGNAIPVEVHRPTIVEEGSKEVQDSTISNPPSEAWVKRA
jgi:hypothetical protein